MTGDERYDTRVALLARRSLPRVAILAATLTGALFLTPAGPLAAAAPAPSTHGPAAATHPVTVRYLDPATGQVTRTEVRQTPVPAHGATEVRSPGALAPDISRVLNCADPNSFWVISNGPPLVCFGNAGDISVAIFAVFEVDAGNNVGNFTWARNGRSFSQPLGRWTSIVFTNRVEVTHIHIN
jgi:hypothetical protein